MAQELKITAQVMRGTAQVGQNRLEKKENWLKLKSKRLKPSLLIWLGFGVWLKWGRSGSSTRGAAQVWWRRLKFVANRLKFEK
ncbi:hypothetical protein GCM10011389_21750 [Pontibacillus salipaludis]|uniref:Uncharacterized protein n=1 Tax=Pontibacillus salipaludis TaxID=1697394 RepID=A0ABQ1Q5G9_9BACI|nr:hypothetical protein GCM10011389_21750 [Pontibacillus salipaludis]